jgi:hypothetical protein
VNDEREPARRPGAESAGDGWDDDPWIIIDDTEDGAVESPATPTEGGFDAPFGTVPFEQSTARRQNPPPSPAQATPPSRPQDPRQSAPQSHRWGSFASNETWNGMQVTPSPSSASAPCS